MATEANAGETVKRALLIGIDKYDHPSREQTTARARVGGGLIRFPDLRGSVNDALSMRKYLVETMGVQERHMVMLLGPLPGDSKRPFEIRPEWCVEEPTYKNIVGALEKMAADAATGDLVYIHYSGHGAPATTVFGKLRGDETAEDHCIVPSDITRGGKYLRDLEFGALLQDIVVKEAILTVVLDCCHSGGAVRGDDDAGEEGVRGIPDIYKSQLPQDLPDGMARIEHWGHVRSWMDDPRGFVFLAACDENQKAREKTCDEIRGVRYKQGFLTYWLLDTIRNTPLQLSSHAVYDRVRAKVLDGVHDQTPYLVGDKDRFFFDGKFRPRVHSLPVRRLVTIKDRTLGRRSIVLGGGAIDGVQSRSVYAILPLASELGTEIAESDVLATVLVKKVDSSQSTTSFVKPETIAESAWAEIKEGCPAVLQSLPIGAKSSVRFVTVDEDRGRQFKESWISHGGNEGQLRLLDDIDDGDACFEISLNEWGEFEISEGQVKLAPHLVAPLDPLKWEEPDESIPRLTRRLGHLARFNMLKGLENPGIRPGSLAPLVSVEIGPAPGKLKDMDGDEYPAAEEGDFKVINGVYEIPRDTWFRFTVTNKSPKHVGCVILNFMPEFGIKVVSPTKSRIPYHCLTVERPLHQDMLVRIPESLQVAAAEGVHIVDIFKVFISTPERDVMAFELQKLKEMEDASRGDEEESLDTLDGLLEELAPLARDGIPPAPEKLFSDWQTVDIQVRALP